MRIEWVWYSRLSCKFVLFFGSCPENFLKYADGWESEYDQWASITQTLWTIRRNTDGRLLCWVDNKKSWRMFKVFAVAALPWSALLLLQSPLPLAMQFYTSPTVHTFTFSSSLLPWNSLWNPVLSRRPPLSHSQVCLFQLFFLQFLFLFSVFLLLPAYWNLSGCFLSTQRSNSPS